MEIFSFWHLIILAIVVLVLFFGWKQLPDMSRSLGRSLRIFKTEIKGMSQDDKVRDSAGEKADDVASEQQPAIESRPAEQAPVAPPRAEVVKNAEALRNRPRPTPGSDTSKSA
jgi:sec-independent protein translocase protein TatA